MGLKGFYGYCLREIPECSKEVNMIEEIKNYKGQKPKIMINLYTLTYHFKIKKKDLVCGYRLNKIKFSLETFLKKIKDAGAELIFVFKKTNASENAIDDEFLTRRFDDYINGQQLIQNIAKIQDIDKMMKTQKLCNKIPFNVLILLCMIQSAEKFGKVYGFDSFESPAAIEMGHFATEQNCQWILGLTAMKFLMPGGWKIWSDKDINIEKMTVHEINKEVIMNHMKIDYQHAPLLISFAGKLKSDENIKNKVFNHFGTKSKFPSIVRFLQAIKLPLTDKEFVEMAIKIFGESYNPVFIEDLKQSIKRYSVESKAPPSIDKDIGADILELIRNNFVSFAEEILLNQKPIFVSPVFMDINSPDMENFNKLVLPIIQKTAGILLKNSVDKETREIVMLDEKLEKFEKYPLEAIYPDFEVPSLKTILSGDLSTYEKIKILSWLLDIELDGIETPCFPEEYTVDFLILLYLIKSNSLTVLDARCILKTLVDARANAISLDCSAYNSKKANSRALRCTFLYSKMYFILHSCLDCFGMKNFRPELQFDGVYFQKMYSLNVLGEPDNDDEELSFEDCANIANSHEAKQQNMEKYEVSIIPNDQDVDQTELIELFSKIVGF